MDAHSQFTAYIFHRLRCLELQVSGKQQLKLFAENIERLNCLSSPGVFAERQNIRTQGIL